MATRTPDVDLSQELVTEFGENATYVSELLARYRANPDSVDEDWRAFFRERLGEPAGGSAPAAPASASPGLPAAVPAAPGGAPAPPGAPHAGQGRGGSPRS